MPPRVTRSSTRLSVASLTNPAEPDPPPVAPSAAAQPPSTRKRKASSQHPPSAEATTATASGKSTARSRSKRTKTQPSGKVAAAESSKARRTKKAAPIMSNPAESPSLSDDQNAFNTDPLPSASKRKTNRKKPTTAATSSTNAPATPRLTRKSKASRPSAAEPPPDEPTEDEEEDAEAGGDSDNSDDTSDESENEGQRGGAGDLNPDDAFGRNPWGGPGAGRSRLESAMQHIHGLITRTMVELRHILENLRQKEDPTVRRLAMEELAHTLLMANEDTLAGHFQPDPYLNELIPMMQGGFDESPETMLMACRCIANMMEALPSSTANVVYGGAVPILCQKLLEIDYIDLAEQALVTLEKISVEFPAAIVREGGLTACLTFLDFFATNVQRTAVTTAANCCRNIPDDSFPTIRDVMPTLLGVLSNSDQKVLEQGCLCVSRIVESFKYQNEKLEELVSEDLLKAILRLLVPGTTNLIGPKIHTQFLRVLAITARASPKRAVSLIKLNVVDTLYQILTGISPPAAGTDLATKIDKTMIMQALIHRPRDQIFETLNVVCEILPDVKSDGLHYLDLLKDAGYPGDRSMPIGQTKQDQNETRIKLLNECPDELRRFTVILLPTLTDAYSSTVNMDVRKKVLTAQNKMLSNVDPAILEEALRNVSYSSFLATILSQGDHVSLVNYALQAAEILLKRLDNIYRFQFYREGVFAEIAKLAARELKKPTAIPAAIPPPPPPPPIDPAREPTNPDPVGDIDMQFHEGQDEEAHEDEDHEEHEDEEEHDEDDEDDEGAHELEHDLGDEIDVDDSTSEDSYHAHPPPPLSTTTDPNDQATKSAKTFVELYDTDHSSTVYTNAEDMLNRLRDLTGQIKTCYSGKNKDSGLALFAELAKYFNQDALSSVTSYELLSSKIVDTLLETFSDSNPRAADARSSFLQAFMGHGTQTKQITANSNSPATPFSVFVHKLQDLLSREEHFEVMTTQHNVYEGGGRNSSASMLAKQVRLKLVAEEGGDVPESYRTTMVHVHALANVKSLADFLRTRLSIPDPSLSDRRSLQDRILRRHRDFPGALAAYTSAFGSGRLPEPGSGSPFDALLARLPGELTNRSIPKRGDRNGATGDSENQTATPSKVPETLTAAGDSATAEGESSSSLRRSSRRQAALVPPPPPPPPPGPNPEEEPLECADEKHITDNEEESTEPDGTSDAINAIMDRLDGLDSEMDVDQDEDPSAVNVEEAPGGKLTARKENGSRVATPVSQTGSRAVSAPRPSASASSALRPNPFPSGSRALSYAAAIASTPQDWHIQFSVHGIPVNPDTTVYRVIHFSQERPHEVSARSMLQATHELKFKKVQGPPPTDVAALSTHSASRDSVDGLPDSLSHNPKTATILRLLSLLHGLNSNIDDVLADNRDVGTLIAEPLSQFVSTKLTAKLNRQLEEPLIVASQCLPTWSEDLARLYPFLFPFETRHLFLQSTSFGFARSMTRWQKEQSSDSHRDRMRDERHLLGRLQRQKVRISRTKMLESGLKVMDLYGSSPAILEVEFFDEVGTGLGPTLEFYATVSKEFAQKRLRLWRTNDSTADSNYVFGSRGLFPAPISEQFAASENGKKQLGIFKSLGKFVARSMLDSRIIDIAFNPTFFRISSTATTVKPSLGAVESVDESLARSLRPLKKAASQKKAIDEDESLSEAEKASAVAQINVSGASIDDLSLDFTLPGYPDIELKPNGASESVTIATLGEYVDAVLDFTLGRGVRAQVEAFQAGFSQVFPYPALQAFTPDELVMLFGRVDEDWSLETLMDSIKADHGFNLDSRSVKNLLQVMSNLTLQERREFLQFVTGSPKLPIGGFKALTPMFTVVCKPSEAPYSSDDYLPSVMTCVNYLKLPDYSSLEVMQKKLDVAMKEGQGAFHLS